MDLTNKSAELIGMHIGDGTLYKTTWGLVWELRGGKDEVEYYEYISKLIEELLQIKFTPKHRAGGSYGIQTSNKQIINFFLKAGFTPGSKTWTVKIPKEILENNKASLHCIRGIFDTDGHLRFDSPNRPKTYHYPRVLLNIASHELIKQIRNILESNGFNVSVWKAGIYYKLAVNGNRNLENWMKFIGFSNPKHFKKHELWKEQGYVKPRSLNLV